LPSPEMYSQKGFWDKRLPPRKLAKIPHLL
jgi:hypothetical protein